eukprot:COSAG05_NODE_2042_length_3648_cov_3.148774_5_plen_102_part_00
MQQKVGRGSSSYSCTPWWQSSWSDRGLLLRARVYSYDLPDQAELGGHPDKPPHHGTPRPFCHTSAASAAGPHTSAAASSIASPSISVPAREHEISWSFNVG